MIEKNKRIATYLFISILALVAVAASYYVLKSNNVKPDPILSNPNVGGNSNISKVVEVESFADYNRIINEKKNTFIVFGKEGCTYCSKYRPVLDKIASDYSIDIVYLNMSRLSEDDYYNVLNSDLSIPAKCAKEGTEIKLKNGFGTPLSLFVNQGKTYDCIRGYKDYETLEILLKTIGYIN